MRLTQHQTVAVLTLDGGKANAIGPDFLRDLNGLLDQLEACDAQAAVITGYGRFFSAGLYLPALVGQERAYLLDFMHLFGSTMRRVFDLPLPVVAAINGHAIAGGCVLALQADLRWMSDDAGKIGLNEAQLGLGLPPEVIEPLRLQVPARSWLPIAMEGQLVSPQAALDLGLVDRLLPATDLVPAAIDRAAQLAAIASPAFRQIKDALRRPARQAIDAVVRDQTQSWLDTWFSAPAQERLQAAVAKLKGG